MRRFTSSIFDLYASDSSNSPSPLAKYLRNSNTTPLAAIENLQTPPKVFNAPLKVEEDVLVMDGILIGASSKGSDSGGVRVRASLKSSDSSRGSGRSLILSSSSSQSSAGGDGGSENRRLCYYKTEKCRSWEVSGICRFGSKGQFAHGKEELRPRLISSSSKNKLEIYQPYNISGGSSSSSYGTKCRFDPHQIKAAPRPAISPPLPIPMALPTSPVEVKNTSAAVVFSTPPTDTFFTSDWTPQDDGIEVTLPCGSTEKENPSREDVNAHIKEVLYGTGSGKRLPVFSEICSLED